MKITCLQDNLSRGLRVVRRAVPSRATLPITQNILLKTEDARLKLVATNLELSITTWVGAQVENIGAVTLPARPLLDVISSYDSGRVDIELTEQPFGAKIDTISQLLNGETAKSSTQLRGITAEDYPPIPKIDDANSVILEATVLHNALDRVVFAAASDDARPVLTGVKMEIEGDQATFAAADGFRLSIETAQLNETAEEPFDALIPARAMTELHSLLAGSTELVEIMVSEDNSEAMFRIGDEVEIVTQLIAGTYPDYQSLVPAASDSTIKIPVEAMEKLAGTAQVIARDGSGIIRLIANAAENEEEASTLTVSSNADEVGNNEGVIDVDVEGESGKIAFNVRFVVDMVNHARGGSSNPRTPTSSEDPDNTSEPQIVLSITTPSSPAVFRLTDHPGFAHVVMPMYVQW